MKYTVPYEANLKTEKILFTLLILLDIKQASFTLIKYKYLNIQIKYETIQQ